ncbi:hypothetical protein QQX10_08025 [Demequina sp. SYSU T00039]|uniref:Sortase family protein n=1 Tax=Demequina lignilytica TaxID=3051663 RepID=A0AAW7M103_9MICO|nr:MULTISPECIES: hypothetical protein [unclassified Demequina]MDN4477536.1 hypothetical protein [Demequina sp. SYSU T00039-1]MDN4488113.1 hypothetical protein [Demequina sp. SYSU T00039]MDN4490554.1 hypothetical protein [Demequina sp. SYSU T00068]
MPRRAQTSALLVAAAAAALILGPAAQAAAPVGGSPARAVAAASLRSVLIPAIEASAEAEFEVAAVDIDVTPAPVAASAPAAGAASTGGTGASSGSDYSFGVHQAGHQAALDRCTGWVWEDFGGYGRVVSAHNHCGGAVVLGLQVGDTVHLTGYGAGDYVVTRLKTVPKGAPATVLEGRLWMQTCTWDNVTMRIAELTRV